MFIKRGTKLSQLLASGSLVSAPLWSGCEQVTLPDFVGATSSQSVALSTAIVGSQSVTSTSETSKAIQTASITMGKDYSANQICSGKKIWGLSGTAACITGVSSVTGTNATASKILTGYTGWDSTGAVINGTMNNFGSIDLTEDWSAQSGFINGGTNYPVAAGVCSATTILGIAGTASCTVSTISAPVATAAQVVAGFKVWSSTGQAITGTMPNLGNIDLTQSVTALSGYFSGVTNAPSGWDFCTGLSIFGVAGTRPCVSGSAANPVAAATGVVSGYNAWGSNGAIINGAMASTGNYVMNLGLPPISPSTASGGYIGAVNGTPAISGTARALMASDFCQGEQILGVSGSMCHRGLFSSPTANTVGVGPSYNPSVVTADFNRDGKLDLAVTSYNDGSVSILIGDGAGGFTFSQKVTNLQGPWALTATDLNQDGYPDLVVTSYDGNFIAVLANTQGPGTFFQSDASSLSGASYKVTSLFSNPAGILAADLDRDGKIDIVVSNFGSNTLTLLRNSPLGTLAAFASSPVTVGSAPLGLAALSFGGLQGASSTSGSGHVHLAVANYSSSNVQIYKGSSTGAGNYTLSLLSTVTHASINAPYSLAGVDYNLDGRTDLIVGNASVGSVVTIKNTSTMASSAAAFAVDQSYSGFTAPKTVVAGDFDVNGRVDFAVLDSGATTAAVYSGSGTGTFSATTTLSGLNGPHGVAVGDFNKEGRSDLAISNLFIADVDVYLGK